jgi:hypothetical protein
VQIKEKQNAIRRCENHRVLILEFTSHKKQQFLER